MGALTTRQQLAEQLATFIRRRGGCTINPLPLGGSDHLRFEVRLSDKRLPNDLERIGFELRLLNQSTRLDPWAVTEIIRIGNSQQFRQHAGIIDICVYEIQLPEIAERKGDHQTSCLQTPPRHRRLLGMCGERPRRCAAQAPILQGKVNR